MKPGESLELLRAVVRSDADVLALRRTGREVAGRLGLDPQDQVRVATALSEVGRSAAAAGGGTATATVRLDDLGSSTLVFSVETTVTIPVAGAVADGGVPAARRLLDDVVVRPGPPIEVVLTKTLPARLSRASLDALRSALGSFRASEPVDEMRAQNAELLRMLDALTESSRELERVNAELEETNRGVLAMYRQLSDELEETNTGVVALYAELDERGRQLSAANEAKTRFLRNVSHELRTPVNSILGLSSLLADSELDDEQRKQVSFLQDSAGALLSLVNELLDLARAESGRQEVDVTIVDLGEVFDELRGTTEPLLRDGVVLDIPCPRPTTLRTDRSLLVRVLRNLLTNAVKFTESGHVRLTATQGPDGDGHRHIRFAVEDTGLGIEHDQLGQIFEEFVQIPNHLQPSARGTGLGLPYARRTVEILGGTLDVVSTPGEGSTFTVTLPVVPPAEREAHAAADREPFLERVLVVDDDDAFRAVVTSLLREAATQVVESRSVREALESARRTLPDVVLLDVRMPDVDGLAGIQQLREEHPHLPVALMSSGPQPVLPAGTGDVPYLAKAELDRASLRAALRRAHAQAAPETNSSDKKE